VAGGLALRGPEIVAVGVAGVLAGCMAAGIVRERPAGSRTRSALEAAASVGATTVGVLLILAGIVALAGGAVAALAVVVALVGVLVARLARGDGRQGGAARAPVTKLPIDRPVRLDARTEAARQLPVAALSTAELGQEWLRTSDVLSGRLDASARAALVARREEALDELERRDPAGFARWLAAGPTLASDPAGFVHGGPMRGDPAADTDAA
jgi:hypothetical protein